MFYDLTSQKRALREAAALAHQRDVGMPIEDRDVHYLQARNADLPMIVAVAVADGLLREDEVGEPAREIVCDLVARIRSMRDSISDTPAFQPPDPYVADAAVSVGTILGMIDMLSELSAIHVNRRTGETVILDEDEFPDDLEEEDTGEDEGGDPLPQWQQDAMRQAREIRESDDWLEVLSRLDIDEYSIMKRFAHGARPSVREALLDALAGKGSFRRFRDEIHRTGSEAAWKEFRSERIAREIREVLDAKGVPYRR